MARFAWIAPLVVFISTLTARGAETPQKSEEVSRDRRGARLPELRLPAEPPAGHYMEPAEGARWEERRRRIGEELSGRAERGPFRCRLRAIPGARAADKPELEVTLSNPSEVPVALPGFEHLNDHVTYIFRGPGGEVVSSFSHLNLHSELTIVGQEPPPDVFGSREVRVATIDLSRAADHGYRPLRPGRYSIEAVFEAVADKGGKKEQRILSRSDRLAVLVGEP